MRPMPFAILDSQTVRLAVQCSIMLDTVKCIHLFDWVKVFVWRRGYELGNEVWEK